MAKKIRSIKDMKKVLQVEEGKEICVKQLVEAREIYIEIAQEGFKNEKYSATNIALSVLGKAFMRLLETPEVSDMRRSIFAQDSGRGYNCILSMSNDEGGHDNILSVKFKNESDVVNLMDNYGFYFNG